MVGNEMIKSESTGSPPKPVTQNAQEWTGVQSKRKFIWSDNLKRDLAKLNRFLAYGTELIQYVGEQNKSLGAWLPPDPKEPVRLFKVKTLKCVERLWAASSRHDTQVQKEVAEKIRKVIEDQKQLWPISLAVLMKTLFGCQPPPVTEGRTAPTSPFRQLAIELLSYRASSMEMLTFCALVERKELSRSKPIKKAIANFYARRFDNFSEQDLLELVLVNRKFGWTHNQVVRTCHVPVKSPLLRVITDLQKSVSNANEDSKNTVHLEALLTRLRQIRSATNVSQVIEAFNSESKSVLSNVDLLFRALPSCLSKEANLWRQVVLTTLDIPHTIKLIPRLLSRFSGNNHIIIAFIERLNLLKQEPLILSPHFFDFFLVSTWLASYKTARPTTQNRSALEILKQKVNSINVKLKTQESLLFLVNLVASPDALVQNKGQRPAVFGGLVTHLDFAAFLIRVFDNSHVHNGNSVVRIAGEHHHVLESLQKIQASNVPPLETWPVSQSKYVIYLTLSGKVPLDAAADFCQDKERRALVISVAGCKQSPLTEFKENLLFINGVDRHSMTLITHFFADLFVKQ